MPPASEDLPGEVSEGLRARTFGAARWTVASTAAMAVLKLAVLSVLARLLTPQDFGLVTAALVVLDFSLQLSEVGLGQALIQRQSIDRSHVATAFLTTTAIGAAISLVYFFGAELFAVLIRTPQAVDLLKVLSVIFLLQAIRAPAVALLQRGLKFRQIFIIETASYVMGYAFVAIACALSGLGYWSLAAGYLAETLLGMLGSLLLVRSSLSWSASAVAFRDLWRFSAAQTVMSMAGYVVLEGDKFVVARYLGPVDLGVYSRAYQLMTIPNRLFSQAIGRLLFPAMSRAQHRPERIGGAYRGLVQLMVLAGTPFLAVAVVFAEPLLLLLLGDQWSASVPPFQILVSLILFRVASKVAYIAVKSTGAVRTLTMVSLLHAFMVIGLSFAFKSGGITLIAGGVAMATILDFALATVLVCRVCGQSIGRLAADIAPALAFGGLLGATLLLLRVGLTNVGAPGLAQLVAGGFMAATVTGLTYWLLWGRLLCDEARGLVRDGIASGTGRARLP